MGENRLQYKLLHKTSEQQKPELTKPLSFLDQEVKHPSTPLINQETEEIFQGLTTPDKKADKLTVQKLEHLKRFIDEIKTETRLDRDGKFQKFRTKEDKRKEESQPRSVPTLLVDLRKPFNKWDVINNPQRQEFLSEINATYKSMWSVIDEIKK
ncbi:3101_t:CDS:2 [Funneliformis geosporum]|nr:3101_t:CDS:2 [Funneliformis geosporum]